MSDQFLAEIRIFPFNFAPRDWAIAAGQLLPISQNTALFSLIGTFYGGNGTSNFQLPNLQGLVPLNQGQGPGLSDYVIGQQDGAPNVTLNAATVPAHTHGFMVSTDSQNLTTVATNNQLCYGFTGDKAGSSVANIYSPNPNSAQTMLALNSVGTAGGSQAHNNMMPTLALNFCIALRGLFPSRN